MENKINARRLCVLVFILLFTACIAHTRCRMGCHHWMWKIEIDWVNGRKIVESLFIPSGFYFLVSAHTHTHRSSNPVHCIRKITYINSVLRMKFICLLNATCQATWFAFVSVRCFSVADFEIFHSVWCAKGPMKCYGHKHVLSSFFENDTNSMAFLSTYLFIFMVCKCVWARLISDSFLSLGKCVGCYVIHCGGSKIRSFRDSPPSLKWQVLALNAMQFLA